MRNLLKIASFIVFFIVARSGGQIKNPCNSLEYKYAVSRYMSKLNKDDLENREHSYLVPFERAVGEHVRAFFPYWQRVDHPFELTLSAGFRSRLMGGEEDEAPLPMLPPGVIRLCDSLSIRRLAVFYLYNDDDHAAGKTVRAQFTHRPDEQTFSEEELYYFVSVYDVAANKPIVEWMEDLDDILEETVEKSPQAAGARAAVIAVEKISESECVQSKDHTTIRAVKRRYRKYSKALLITGICAAFCAVGVPLIIIPLGD